MRLTPTLAAAGVVLAAGGRSSAQWRVTPEDLASVWAARLHGAVGVEGDLPAPAVNKYLVMKFAEERTVVSVVSPPWLLCRMWCTSEDADIPRLMDQRRQGGSTNGGKAGIIRFRDALGA